MRHCWIEVRAAVTASVGSFWSSRVVAPKCEQEKNGQGDSIYTHEIICTSTTEGTSRMGPRSEDEDRMDVQLCQGSVHMSDRDIGPNFARGKVFGRHLTGGPCTALSASQGDCVSSSGRHLALSQWCLPLHLARLHVMMYVLQIYWVFASFLCKYLRTLPHRPNRRRALKSQDSKGPAEREISGIVDQVGKQTHWPIYHPWTVDNWRFWREDAPEDGDEGWGEGEQEAHVARTRTSVLAAQVGSQHWHLSSQPDTRHGWQFRVGQLKLFGPQMVAYSRSTREMVRVIGDQPATNNNVSRIIVGWETGRFQHRRWRMRQQELYNIARASHRS